MSTVSGIDVASYQSTTYGTAGLGFVIAKSTEGVAYINGKHAAQVAHGRAAGLVVGHYHFARPGSVSSQAAYFLQHAAPAPGDLLVYDWEDPGVTSSDKDAWIRAVQNAAPAHRVLLYCNRDFWLSRDDSGFAGDGLWIADPGAPAGKPRVSHGWVIHQYSEAGGTDHDVADFASKAAMATWALKGAKAPATAGKRLYEPFPGASWFAMGRRSPLVARMHGRLAAEGCGRYRTTANKDVIGAGDVASYEAWQAKYSAQHHKGWTGAALKWPPGKESWDALHVPD